MITVFICLLCLSSLANIALAYLFLQKKTTSKPDLTWDARALLMDLASGSALVKIEYLDRSEVLLRSPRQM